MPHWKKKKKIKFEKKLDLINSLENFIFNVKKITHLDGRTWQNLSCPVVFISLCSCSFRRFIVEYKLNIFNFDFLTLATSQTRNIIFLLLFNTEFIVLYKSIETECCWFVFDVSPFCFSCFFILFKIIFCVLLWFAKKKKKNLLLFDYKKKKFKVRKHVTTVTSYNIN